MCSELSQPTRPAIVADESFETREAITNQAAVHEHLTRGHQHIGGRRALPPTPEQCWRCRHLVPWQKRSTRREQKKRQNELPDGELNPGLDGDSVGY